MKHMGVVCQYNRKLKAIGKWSPLKNRSAGSRRQIRWDLFRAFAVRLVRSRWPCVLSLDLFLPAILPSAISAGTCHPRPAAERTQNDSCYWQATLCTNSNSKNCGRVFLTAYPHYAHFSLSAIPLFFHPWITWYTVLTLCKGLPSRTSRKVVAFPLLLCICMIYRYWTRV